MSDCDDIGITIMREETIKFEKTHSGLYCRELELGSNILYDIDVCDNNIIIYFKGGKTIILHNYDISTTKYKSIIQKFTGKHIVLTIDIDTGGGQDLNVYLTVNINDEMLVSKIIHQHDDLQCNLGG
jgi:hypothetical protein